MKSIPVVEQVYQAILVDMTLNFNVLLNSLEQKLIVLGNNANAIAGDLNEDDAEAALIFDCSALCQIGNIKGNLIGVSNRKVSTVVDLIVFRKDVRTFSTFVRTIGEKSSIDKFKISSKISSRTLWSS